jgi:predicted RNase H-related nuclease YkuK (DUF458 family)
MQPYRFYNMTNKNMNFEDVVKALRKFIREDPRRRYILSIGTDSQVHPNKTYFITAVHLHRVGKGAWGCLKNYEIARKIKSVREKISLETSLSEEIANHFTEEYLNLLMDEVIPFMDEGGDLHFELHLDIGKKGITKDLINEMVNRIEALGIDAKIKPESYTASSYANRYTK